MATTLHDPPKQRQSSTPLPVVATSNDGVLPLDLLYDILLCLPAETICRFRAVSRSWRSLLCHPDFIAAAHNHNPGPLIGVGITDYCSRNEVTIFDMESGDAVTRVNIAADDLTYGEAHSMIHNHNHDRMVCLHDPQNRLRLLDLDNEAIFLLPDYALPPGYKFTWCTVARVTYTGEHKVLAMGTTSSYDEPVDCKILTLGPSDGGWRNTGGPPRIVFFQHSRNMAVINGVGYFLSLYIKSNEEVYAASLRGPVNCPSMVFDFNKEAWWPAEASLRGPVNCPSISLAELDGHLVAGHYVHKTIPLWSLWFLMDSDRSLWSKRYTITMPWQPATMRYADDYFEKPLPILEDGKIVMWMRVYRQGAVDHDIGLRIYNPRTKTFKDGTVVPRCSRMHLFTWNLLRTGHRGALDDAVKRLLMGRRRH